MSDTDATYLGFTAIFGFMDPENGYAEYPDFLGIGSEVPGSAMPGRARRIKFSNATASLIKMMLR